MISLGEFALLMQGARARVQTELTLEVHKVLGEVAKDAEAMIGTERPEWAPLAESTIKEKTALGYVGQVSATDPLLRTGEMRGSIESDAQRRGNTVEGVVGSNSKVAVYQEMGTAKIPSRPFLASALHESQHVFEEALGQFAVKALTGPFG